MTNLLVDRICWPRYLSREEAAHYVDVPPEVFDAEVQAGEWPRPRRRTPGNYRRESAALVVPDGSRAFVRNGLCDGARRRQRQGGPEGQWNPV
jgi:hypothetical protein